MALARRTLRLAPSRGGVDPAVRDGGDEVREEPGAQVVLGDLGLAEHRAAELVRIPRAVCVKLRAGLARSFLGSYGFESVSRRPQGV